VAGEQAYLVKAESLDLARPRESLEEVVQLLGRIAKPCEILP